ncbi:MAG TPA: biotin--[acetyl-CoA-carboxylase] ligase [Thermodesulfobacteriota bacterium]|nr:biotin--[acetyl-CoA-carboxylase] ligase [Thermodesulfobacteriota bacterium]
MNDEILRLLKERPSDFISGEEISRRLRITRTAVWKRVRSLRILGYVIEAFPRSGYRLIQSPDLLLPTEIHPTLRTKWIGKKIHYFNTIDSTNSVAYQLALEGARQGEVVIAESQEKGRGRLGRQWISPPFLNLYLSVILRPDISPHQASLITFLAAVATADAIEIFSGLRPSIKWPNDLLLGKRKVAGLLNEIHSETDHIHFVILGMGVNLNMDEKGFPRTIRLKATSLKREMGRSVSRKAFVVLLLEELERWYETFLKEGGNPVLKAWRDRARIQGRRVRVTSFGEVLIGRAVNIDSDGTLILTTQAGKRKRIVAGDIEYK